MSSDNDNKNRQYLELEIKRVQSTIKNLSNRISERFPTSGLSEVCSQLYDMSKLIESRGAFLRKPNVILRATCAIIISLVVTVIIVSLTWASIPKNGYDVAEYIQILDSTLNDVIVIGGTILFFATYETRFKRTKALSYLKELRALAHIVDMHQLTKDPERLVKGVIRTPSSPVIEMDSFQLSRYLDYCTEMLSLLGKLAAIYAQYIDDSVVLEAVNEIEMLTSNLSQKVWLKVIKTANMKGKSNPVSF